MAKMAKMDGGAAFPTEYHRGDRAGMTLRDWFAGQAMAGYFAAPNTQHRNATDCAAYIYEMADAMLAARASEAVNPLQAELDDAREHIAMLESLRPHWAQGFSSDGVAAQAQTAALSSIWEALGVSNQTEAMQRIRELVAHADAMIKERNKGKGE